MAELKKSETVAGTVKVEEAPKQKESEPISTPVSVHETPATLTSAPTVVYVEKKSGFGWGKCCLAGCVVLLLCCICTIVFAVVAPNLLVKTLTGGNRAPDPSLTRITTLAEFKQLEATQTKGMDSFMTANTNGDVQVLMKEKDVITLILISMGVETTKSNTATVDNIQKVGVKLTPGKAVIEMDLGLLVPLMKSSQSADMQNFDPKTFDGVNFSVTLSTSADNKSFVIDNFSTGNNILDSIIPAQLKSSLLESVQQSIEKSLSDSQDSQVSISRIEFRQGELMMLLKVNQAGL